MWKYVVVTALAMLANSRALASVDVPIVWLAAEMGQAGREGHPCVVGSTCNTGLACLASPGMPRCEAPLGSVSNAYGGPENRCVESYIPGMAVEMSFSSWNTTLVSYASREGTALPPDGHTFPDLDFINDHVQGIGRIPGYPGERLMVLTISNNEGSGGMFFVDVGQVNGNGGEEFSYGVASNKTLNRNIAYFRMPTDHPGGLQVIGQIAATVGMHSGLGRPVAWFYDVSDPTMTSADDALIQTVDLNSLGPAVVNNTSAVAVTRLKSGRYFMIVNGGSLGSTRRVWMYASDQNTLTSSTNWRFHNYQEYPVAFGTENMNFLTQCGSGSLYVLHTSNDSNNTNENGSSNKVATHRLTVGSDSRYQLTSANASTGGFQNEGHCNFRSAANYHVTPSGEMVLYCASRNIFNEDGNFKFAERPEPL